MTQTPFKVLKMLRFVPIQTNKRLLNRLGTSRWSGLIVSLLVQEWSV